MQTYTTQMDAARKGIITPEMEIVAKKEYRTTEEIRQWVAEGKVAIPANKHHKCLNPEGVGSSQQPTLGASCIYKCNMIKFYRQIALNDRMKRTPRRQYELS